MPNENWEQLMETANRELKYYGAQLHVERVYGMGCYGDVNIYIDWDNGESKRYARAELGNELEPLILEAKQHAFEDSEKWGGKIIICIIHAELPGRHDKVTHWKKLFGNERAAMRWLNNMVPAFLDKPMRIKKDTDTEEVNEALAEQYDDPNNERFYVRMEDVTEQTEIAIQELFSMHQWSFKDLTYIADAIGIDYEKCFL